MEKRFSHLFRIEGNRSAHEEPRTYRRLTICDTPRVQGSRGCRPVGNQGPHRLGDLLVCREQSRLTHRGKHVVYTPLLHDLSIEKAK
jgi:hypothetical protein